MKERIDVGLTFYGGVSLAVFEAGVAYELIRALQYSREAEIPDLHVDVISGTSAGGLTAIQIAAALAGRNPDGVLAKMLSMWANVADITRLLPKGSYTGQGLLDNTVLKDGVLDFLRTARSGESAPLEDDLEFILTVTNFSGLREPVMLPQGDEVFQSMRVFPTTRHVEYERFDAEAIRRGEEHAAIALAGACTAGFPVAFDPTVKQSSSLPEDVAQEFVYVDGGLRDNRPLGVAIDAIQQRPSPDRRYYFIDPNETFVPNELGAGPEQSLAADPWTIYGSLLSVARADSIYDDIEKLRTSNNRQTILKTLAGCVCASAKRTLEGSEPDGGLQTALLALHGDFVSRGFNSEADGLMGLLKAPADADVSKIWGQILEVDRFVLRERANEFLDLLHENGQLDDEGHRAVRKVLNQPERWERYYQVVRRVNAHSKTLRNLRFRVWREAYRDSNGTDRDPEISAETMQAVEAALSALLLDLKELETTRTRLAQAILSDFGQPEFEELFFNYAKAMQVLESLAGPAMVRRVFSRAKVPRALLRDRRQRLPIGLLASLYAEGADVTGDSLFGFSVGATMHPSDYGLWAEYAAQAPTLAAAISRARRTLHTHQTGSAMRLAGRPAGLVAWEYWHREIATPHFRHHSEHVLAVMINFVRRYLGADWNPAGVEMCYSRPDNYLGRERATGSDWTFDQACVAITIPETQLASRAPLLDAEHGTTRRLRFSDVLAESRSPGVADLLDQTMAIITLRLLEGATDIDGTARMLRTSPRTLQRYLRGEGLTYRSLVARTRMQQAKTIIESSDVPLKCISYDLGYHDPADFTRAFRRYFGYPPSLLRAQATRRPA